MASGSITFSSPTNIISRILDIELDGAGAPLQSHQFYWIALSWDADYPYSDGGANRTIRVNYDTAYSPTLGFVRYSSNSENIYNNALWKQTLSNDDLEPTNNRWWRSIST